MESTELATLRTPHPRQQQIDLLSASLLRATALDVLRRRQKALPAAVGTQPTAKRNR